MNAKSSVERLPESIRTVIGTEPSVSSMLRSGWELPDILSSPEWASRWTATADPLLKRILGWLLLRHAAVPFGEEKAKEAQQQSGFTGAELRVALARLRRAGILFAVRKTWGDRLFYVPEDMVPVWQRLVLPVPWTPLRIEEAAAVVPDDAPHRLPLSLELLSVWALISRQPISLTVKGALPKPVSARLASAMRLKADELAPLQLVYPQHDQLASSAALALDLGLATGVLIRREHEITISKTGLSGWLPHSVKKADAELHRLALLRYASQDPARHLAASAVASCSESGWFREADAVRTGIDAAALDLWLGAMASFGWAERGRIGGAEVFRLLTSLSDHEQDDMEHSGTECVLIQPDGEIYVQPEAGMEARWRLEEIGERIKGDRVFIYRLTRASCSKAYESGWREADVAGFLERISETPLPETVAGALRDWYSAMGRVRIAEVVLLRTDNSETARQLSGYTEISDMLGERIGERDFIVARANLKNVIFALEKFGFPATASGQEDPVRDEPKSSEKACDPGWVYNRPELSLYEPDRTISSEKELFPGLSEVPAAWLKKPGTYHVSTRQQLVRQAVGWQTALRIGDDGEEMLFVPQSVQVTGEDWVVLGRYKNGNSADGTEPLEPVAIAADRLDSLMIVLPGWEAASFSGASPII